MADGRHIAEYWKRYNSPINGPIWMKHGWSHPIMSPMLIQKTLDVLSLLRPIVHDTSKTAKITWFILVLHWAVDVIEVIIILHPWPSGVLE